MLYGSDETFLQQYSMHNVSYVYIIIVLISI